MLRSRHSRSRTERRPHRRASDKPGQGSPAEAVDRVELERKGERDLERARTAGGPLDSACYSCSCGFVFTAAVSTGVVCPHCGARQAW
jgi:rubrerythrin